MSRRALLIVLDSVGVGNAPDAAQYGDAGTNTVGHIIQRVPDIQIPTLRALGLDRILGNGGPEPRASWGRMREQSAGKDTTTGHWEIAGAIVREPFGTFEKFPPELVSAIEREAGVTFVGNFPASGTAIIEQLGAEHVAQGRPILYTSADPVMQIAAHEEAFGLERLYEVCKIARRHCDPFRVGRVIARPFTGKPGAFTRTANRHDYSMLPPRTVLNALRDAGVPVISVGKISDIFAGSGISESHPTKSNAHGMETIAALWREQRDGLIFVNLVDFDMLFGHRRDVAGYARALEEFDAWFAGFMPRILPDDLIMLTADHGNDPTHTGTDHTREEVPLIVLHKNEARDLGTRETYADAAATLADFFGPAPWPEGRSFLK
jgi:phosphopentomutase